jgi:hypothetical protein
VDIRSCGLGGIDAARHVLAEIAVNAGQELKRRQALGNRLGYILRALGQ